MPGGRQGGHKDNNAGDQSGHLSLSSMSPSPAALHPAEIPRREQPRHPDCNSVVPGGLLSKQSRQVVPNSGAGLK